MPKHYARIIEGRVAEIIAPMFDADGSEIPIRQRFHPAFVSSLVPYDPANPPAEPEAPAPALPRIVTPYQARAALLSAGLLESVEAAIAQIPDETQRRRAQLAWEYATVIDRDSEFIQLLAPALGIDEAGLDALFAEAATW